MKSSNKILLITGTSQGIGTATDLKTAHAGYAIGLNYLKNQAATKNIAQKIQAAGGCTLLLQGDIEQEKDVQHMFQTLTETFGPLTALVNNAGILEPE